MPATDRSQQGIELDVPWCFTDDHRSWRTVLRNFTTSVLAPTVSQRTIDATFDESIVDGLGELGVFGLRVSEEYGGSGSDITSFCLAVEEITRVDGGVGASAHVQGIACALFERLANDEQKKEILPRAARGEIFISFGLTEPSGGSDAGNIRTAAVRDGDGWRLNGSKAFITNPGTPRSKYVILFAATGPGRPGRPEVSAFLVPLDAPGVEVGPAYDKIGWRTSNTHPLYFDDVHLGPDTLLGEVGRGYREALGFLTWARLPIASASVGIAQGCLDATLDFVQTRESFNQRLGDHQAVGFKVARMAAATAAARSITYDACWKMDHGHSYEQEAAMCKLVASEICNKVAYDATQLHGGAGFMMDSAVTRLYGDARVMTIGEGASEVQQMLIGRSLGLKV